MYANKNLINLIDFVSVSKQNLKLMILFRLLSLPVITIFYFNFMQIYGNTAFNWNKTSLGKLKAAIVHKLNRNWMRNIIINSNFCNL